MNLEALSNDNACAVAHATLDACKDKLTSAGVAPSQAVFRDVVRVVTHAALVLARVYGVDAASALKAVMDAVTEAFDGEVQVMRMSKGGDA